MANITVDAKNVRQLPGCITRLVNAGEAMAVGKVIQIVADSDAEMANAGSAAGVAGLLGIVVAGNRYDAEGDIANGERITIVIYGPVFLGENASLDETKTYYVSATDGVITDVAPAQYRAVGFAQNATTLIFAPVTTVPAS